MKAAATPTAAAAPNFDGRSRRNAALRAVLLYAPELRAQAKASPNPRGPTFSIERRSKKEIRSEREQARLGGAVFVVRLVADRCECWPLGARSWGAAADEIRDIAIGAATPLSARVRAPEPPPAAAPPKSRRRK